MTCPDNGAAVHRDTHEKWMHKVKGASVYTFASLLRNLRVSASIRCPCMHPGYDVRFLPFRGLLLVAASFLSALVKLYWRKLLLQRDGAYPIWAVFDLFSGGKSSEALVFRGFRPGYVPYPPSSEKLVKNKKSRSKQRFKAGG